jgi:4-hydroxy-tetrahydrodipicolinate reductase
MNPHTLRFLVFGLGQTGLTACRILLARSASIAGVYSRSRHVGEDLGRVLERPALGLAVRPVDAFMPRAGEADVALFFTTSSLADLTNEAAACLRAGIRVLTVAEEAASPWLASPAIAASLDAAARAGGSALLATGMNDVAMAHLPVALAAMSSGVRRITSHTVASLDRLGPQTLAGMGIGADPASAAGPADDPQTFSICASVAAAIVTLTDGHVEHVRVRHEPVIACTDLQLHGLDIAKGRISGMREVATAISTDGMQVDVSLVGKVFEVGDTERVDATVDGHPGLTMTLRPTPSAQAEEAGFVEATAAIVLNRVATLMQAPPGLVTFDRCEAARYAAAEAKRPR